MREHTLVDGSTVTNKDMVYYWNIKMGYSVNADVSEFDERDFEKFKSGDEEFSQFYSTAESRDKALQEYIELSKSKTLKEIKDFIGDRNLIIADELLDFFKG